jgi:DNA transformation protein and related proteins
MAITAGFIDALTDALSFLPELKIKRMFGGAGVYTAGLMFALADDEALWLKTDEESDPLFVAEGLEAFTFRDRKGRTISMTYRRAPDEIWDDPDAARRWVQLGVASALRKKAKAKIKGKRPAKTKPGSLLISGPWDDG